MPVISPSDVNPFADARQSERALEIRTGTTRHFRSLGWISLPELTLGNGRRADLAALNEKGDIIIVEVKSSVADLRADQKWPEYLPWCDFLYFATSPDVPAEIFPKDAGLIYADQHGAEILREAAEHRLKAARRKNLHIRFARAAAIRLERCCTHAGLESSQFANNP